MRTRDLDKQQRIKDAMISLILKEGINGASVAKIAKKAGVSPATIYVYYENKEEMLKEVFCECTYESYSYISKRIYPHMSGADLIDTLVRGFYIFASQNREVFSFVEQCQSCPTIEESVRHNEYSLDVFNMIHDYQRQGILKPYSDINMAGILFSPVKFLAANRDHCPDPEEELSELISMMQKMLLK